MIEGGTVRFLGEEWYLPLAEMVIDLDEKSAVVTVHVDVTLGMSVENAKLL